MKEYFCKENYLAKENSIIDTIDITKILSSFFDKSEINSNISDAWINIGGWQSWNPGFEIAPKTKQPSLNCRILKQWNNYINFPGTKQKPTKNIVLAQFITYFRWDNFYLVFVSCGNLKNVLPPVQFIINKSENTIGIELADTNKQWTKNELQAQIEIFTAESYFEVQEKLKNIFGTTEKDDENYSSRFDSLQFLGKTAYGWESWYNHYEKINHQLILQDLEALKTTDNLLKLTEKMETTDSVVFQIDDGWEKQLGTWEIDDKAFPNGLKTITEKIEEKNLVPGLWIAPFIVDLRSKSAIEHPQWLLRNKKGNLIKAGFNPRWGSFGTFYCLDLGNDEVISYLDNLIETAINDWGFRYIKLDFLYAGMLCGKSINNKSAYENFTNAISILTKRKQTKDGKPVAYLGCGTPFELSFKNLPLSRIGCDTYEHWENKISRKLNWNGRNEAYLNIKDTLGHALWDKIIFANDPDVLFIRNENCSLTYNEKILIATVAALFGSQIMYSDDPASLKPSGDSNNNLYINQEIELSKEINRIIEKYKDETFSIKNIRPDYYEIESKNGKYHGYIDLEKDHKIVIE